MNSLDLKASINVSKDVRCIYKVLSDYVVSPFSWIQSEGVMLAGLYVCVFDNSLPAY